MIHFTKYMQIAYRLTLSLLCCTFLYSCSDRAALESVEQVLATAEEQIYERPDSSLALLNTIDFERLSRKQRPAYALLLSQAKDKCYIDEVDDSLINIAVKYYSTDKDVERRFLAYYYQGRVYANGGNYAKAMLSYQLAEELIPDITNPYNIALLYAHIGIINELLYNYSSSLASYMEAYKYYNEAGAIVQSTHTMFNVAKAYFLLNQYEEAKNYYNITISKASENGLTDLVNSCVEFLALIYEYTNDTTSLESLLAKISEDEINNSIILTLAKAHLLAIKHNNIPPEKYINKGWDMATNQRDTITMYARGYDIFKQMGNYERALNYHEKLYNIQDSIARQLIQEPIVITQRDYFQSQAEYNAIRLEYNKKIYSYVLLVIICIVCIIAGCIRHRIIAKNHEIQHYMELVDNLRGSMYANKSNMDKMGGEIKSMSQQIDNLFFSQFSLIDRLSNTYYETHGTKRDREAIYLQVRKEIEKQ